MNTIEIRIKVTDSPQAARNCGYTKNHRLVEMQVASAWRAIGFFTAKQIDVGAWKRAAMEKIRVNTNYTGRVTFANWRSLVIV